MAKLMILIGVPGAGKTTFAKTKNARHVSSDAIRREIFGGESVEYSEKIANDLIQKNSISLIGLTEEQKISIKQTLCINHIFCLARNQCCDYLKSGEDVIYDSTNFKKKYRRIILDEANGLYTECEAYFFDIPLEVALSQNNKRARKEPEQVIKSIYKTLERPTYDEGFKRIFVVGADNKVVLLEKSDLI